MATPSCNRLQRWWHTRLRNADRRHLWPVLLDRASVRHPEDPRRALHMARVAWKAHQALPGETHWTCPCGVAMQGRVEAE